jgi:hypothetical protein
MVLYVVFLQDQNEVCTNPARQVAVNFVWWNLIFMCPRYITCFMSHLWRLEFCCCYYYYYYYYYYLTAIGLTPGGISTHLHTNSTQNTEDGTHITITRKKLGSAGRAPSLRVLPWHLPYS